MVVGDLVVGRKTGEGLGSSVGDDMIMGADVGESVGDGSPSEGASVGDATALGEATGASVGDGSSGLALGAASDAANAATSVMVSKKGRLKEATYAVGLSEMVLANSKPN